MAELVKFNIGGQRYEVFRSLLDKHPNSMLSKRASKQLQVNPDTELFIVMDCVSDIFWTI